MRRMTTLSEEPSEELSWMQGPAAREGDVDKDKAIAIATDALKDKHQCFIAVDVHVIIMESF